MLDDGDDRPSRSETLVIGNGIVLRKTRVQKNRSSVGKSVDDDERVLVARNRIKLMG